MPRVAIPLKCEPKVMQELERLSRNRTEETRLVERAKIILACLSGKQNDVIALEHKTQPATVGVWRKRFAAEGLTPTSASWLNQVEIWFGILGRKTLSGASFSSTEQLVQSIEAFVARHNETATPFVWRKREVKGAQLRNTIVNLCN